MPKNSLWRRARAARMDLVRTREDSAAALAALGALEQRSAEALAISRGLGEQSATMLEATRALQERSLALEAQLATIDASAQQRHLDTIGALRVVRDDDASAWNRLWELRRTAAYESAFDTERPLVTAVVTTYRNAALLKERSIPSLLGQTYENLEIIVVGDAAGPDVEAAARSFDDPRLRWVNLPQRSPYPDDPRRAWLVYGTTPFNTGWALARGAWIVANSDDDAFRPDHVETLLTLAQRERAEVAYGQIAQHEPGGATTVLGAFPPAHGQWGIQCSILHAGLGFLPLHPSDWRFGVPNDWSFAERLLRIGARFAQVERPVVDYYPSAFWGPEASAVT